VTSSGWCGEACSTASALSRASSSFSMRRSIRTFCERASVTPSSGGTGY
jgi:hypothetical protein